MEIIKPYKLKKGDTIGIVSPASPLAGKIPSRFQRGIKNTQKLGYKVKIGKNATTIYGHTAGKPEERAEDLHSMFEDPEVKAIICAVGGYNSNELLELLDYNLIKKNPKIFVGYSDTTSLHNGIHSQTGLVTFYGPAVMPQFGEFPQPLHYTVENMEKVLCNAKPAGELMLSREYTYEKLWWGKEDNKPRKMVPNTGWKCLKSGEAEGNLIGGHLGTLEALSGTKYFPSFKNSIFFWEETESSTPETHRSLVHLKMLGVFDQVNGMIVGRTNPTEYEVREKDYGLDKIILDVTRGYDFPIITEMDFGHTDPILTLPYGIKAYMNADLTKFSLLESAVRK